MFDWLFEGRMTVYLLLGLVAAGLAGLWWRNRSRPWLIAAGLAAAVVGGYHLLDRLVETGREQITRKVKEMAGSVERGDADRLLQHVSPQFNWNGLNRDRFGAFVKAALAASRSQGVKVSNFSFLDQQGKVRFQATAWDRQGNPYPGHVIASFAPDPDGQWRMRTMEIFYGNSTTPVTTGELSRWAGP